MIYSKNFGPFQETKISAGKRDAGCLNTLASQAPCGRGAKDTMVAMVAMEDGSERKIEDICLGDRVATPAYSGDIVTNIMAGIDQKVYCLQLTNGSTLRTTGNHPVLTESGWKAMQDLAPEDIVQTFNQGGQPIESVKIGSSDASQGYSFMLSREKENHAIVCNGIIVGDFDLENTLQRR